MTDRHSAHRMKTGLHASLVACAILLGYLAASGLPQRSAASALRASIQETDAQLAGLDRSFAEQTQELRLLTLKSQELPRVELPARLASAQASGALELSPSVAIVETLKALDLQADELELLENTTGETDIRYLLECECVLGKLCEFARAIEGQFTCESLQGNALPDGVGTWRLVLAVSSAGAIQ